MFWRMAPISVLVQKLNLGCGISTLAETNIRQNSSATCDWLNTVFVYNIV